MNSKRWLSVVLAALLVGGMAGLTLAGCGSSAQGPSITTPSPILTALSVNSGAPGSEIRLTGQGFGDGVNSRVDFAGATAGVAEWRDTYIDVFVPASCTSGAVSVTTPGGTSNPIGFTVEAGSTWGGSDTAGSGEDEAGGMTEEQAMISAMQEFAGGMVTVSDWNFEIIKISSIDPKWALGSAAHKYHPESYQGEIFWLHKVGGTWTVVDAGTGLDYTDVGAPSDLSP